jgi:hypothetical protein
MKLKLASLGLIFFYAGLSSCTTFMSSDESVLERSAQYRPAWADSDFSGEGRGDRFVIATKKQVPKLELGIKQAQAAALQNPCGHAHNRISQDILNFSKELKIDEKKAQNFSANILSKLGASNYCPRLKPETVYWEQISDKNTGDQHYDIYVLLTMQKANHTEGLNLAAMVLSGGSEEEKKLLERMRESIED